jgi:hypothetical protein
MAIPDVYKGLTPSQINGGLTPLQLALVNYMITGETPPFGPNQDFLKSVNKYADSGLLTPSTTDPRTGLPIIPPILPDVVAIAYLTSGTNIYMLREAQDCGPDEQGRVEKVFIGDRSLVAAGTFAYYGPPIYEGTAATGSYGGWNDGGGQ